MQRDLTQLSQVGNIFSTLGGLNNNNLNNAFYKKNEIITVNGFQEAKDFKLNKEESILMLDTDGNILYVKECDSIGKYTLKVFECSDITDKYEKEHTSADISKADFENLMQTMKEMKSILTTKGGNNGKYDAQ